MNILKMAAMTTALAALSFGCGDDDDDDHAGPIDGGSKMDAGTDAAQSDSGGGQGGGDFACPSWTPPMNGKCGGPHCEQTEAELRGATPTTAVCGSNSEVAGLCNLTTVAVVSGCAVSTFLSGTPTTEAPAAIATCTRNTVSEEQLSDGCLTCYVNTSLCAGTKCLSVCIDPNTTACDECRVREGCVSQFYACSGFTLP